jgi:molybdopterin molybdotransferase
MVETGAPLPDGTDTIISSEFAVRENSKKVNIYKREKPGEHIDIRGGIIEEGELVFRRNRILCPADIGVLGALGMAEVPCYRNPRVSFFAIGNELIQPDRPACSGKIRSSNICSIEAHLKEYAAIPINMGIVGLYDDQIAELLKKSIDSDMIIVSTGASPAVFDKVKITLQKIGMDLKFWRVAIRPGKPLVFGVYENIPIFGITEDHQSTTIVMEEFVRPAIMRMRGKREIRRTEVVARLDGEIKGGGGKTHFVGAEVRLTDDGFLAIPENHRPSTRLGSFISANGIIVVPPEVSFIQAGEFVKIQIIGDPTEMN